MAIHSGDPERGSLDLADDQLALMDEAGINTQVLSLTTLTLHNLRPECIEMAKRNHDAVAAVLARHPARSQALATLPVAMPDEDAVEFERCVRMLGFKGTMLPGRVTLKSGHLHPGRVAFARMDTRSSRPPSIAFTPPQCCLPIK